MSSSTPWPSSRAACDNISQFGYCSWKGVNCCCYPDAPPDITDCQFCQAISSPRGGVAEINLKGGSLSGPAVRQVSTRAALPCRPRLPCRTSRRITARPACRRRRALAALGPLGPLGLYDLSLANNNLSGSLPANLSSSFPLLATLNLGSNRLVSGSIPADLADLPQLTELNFEFTRLSGEVPVMCRDDSRLADVFLRGANLSGGVGTAFYNCSRLISLVLQVGMVQ